MPEYKVEKKKIVFNADFKPSIDFFPRQYDIAKKLNNSFPDWELTEGVAFIMQDRMNNCSATITHKKIIFEVEEANGRIELSKERINQVLTVYNGLLPIDSFTRIGIRFFMFIPMNEIKKEELAEIIESKLFATNTDLDDVLSGKISDLAYIRDYSSNDYMFHLKCGPMPKEHIPTWVEFGEYKHRFKTNNEFKKYFDDFPKMSIFIDVDCYKNNIMFGELNNFLNKAIENCSQTSAKLKKYILGE